jgi:hypothetical protein
MDFSGASWFVRSFYDVWLALPYVSDGMAGVGSYALSREGRARFGEFPDVINDDSFVRSLFGPAERPVLPEAVTTVTAPATLGSLIRIVTRTQLGAWQLREQFPALASTERGRRNYRQVLRQVALRPRAWCAAWVYLVVNVVARCRARRQRRPDRTQRWERDETSRRVHGGEPRVTRRADGFGGSAITRARL